MKKTLIFFLLFIGAATVMTSCKKTAAQTEKERVLELLTSGKWYYQSYQNLPDGEIYTCFNAVDYFEFETDGSFEETWDFGNSTYTIAEDGKSIVLNLGEGGAIPTTATVTITETSLKLVIDWDEGGETEYIFSKTASVCL
ncbi:MAG: hypothetical protein IT275_08135 [Chitinophagales bacterium]|nr:hypothetical protein [Chitinophagales bacterium]HMV14071.1 hypothetical protein [Chitinophagales bacterium]HMW12463.1 hypothetical protein [Chitinophagales bacterium]HMX59989.1 hypothetical protein [Chitinophagales bacterium]HMY23316.1 hypothetical protein [Chitinophagales bacterium]